METFKRHAEFGTWRAPGRPLEVVYSRHVLDEVTGHAVEGLSEQPAPAEVCGVLFGTADQDEARITLSRPVRREPGSGGALEVTDQDLLQLRRLVEEYTKDEDLHGLIPIGWYLSRLEGPIALSDEEVRLFNRFFPLPYQITLGLRAEWDKPVRAGFFIREPGKDFRRDSSYLEFNASPVITRPIEATAEPEGEAAGEPALAPIEEEPAIEAAAPRLTLRPLAKRKPVEAQEPAPEFVPPPSSGKMRLPIRLTVLAGGLGAILVCGYLFTRGLIHQPAPEPKLQLELMERAGQIRATWDGRSPFVQSLSAARLEIDDGAGVRTVALNESLLANGQLPIPTTSQQVRVRMLAGPEVSAARYLSSRTRRAKAALADPRADKLREEVDALRQRLDTERRQNYESDNRLETLREQIHLHLSGKAAARP